KGVKVEPPVIDYAAGLTDSNFAITYRPTSIRMTKRTRSKLRNVNVNQFTFMRQLDQTLEKRKETRGEREQVATTFRRLGNHEFRRNHFDSAIEMYNNALSYIRDTPVLYLNRAACYIKLRNFKRSIMDCDYILNNLDPKNLRAWLYRGLAYKRYGDETNFNYSLYQAKRLNSGQSEFIENFLERMRTAT
ncbi:hypothetical protein KR222_007469, partial [Zaprionus bogoriensis]